MKILVFLSLVLAICFSNSTTSKVISQSSDAPFLYYYAYAEEAFIVEQADGSKRDVMIEYELPEPKNLYHIIGDGWSPSGKWFVWSVDALDSFYTDAKPVVYLKHRDNELFSSVALLQRDFVTDIKWSPTNDILLIRSGTVRDSEFSFTSYIINMNAIESPISLEGNYDWSASGDFLIYEELNGDVTIVDTTGQITSTSTFDFPQFFWSSNNNDIIYKMDSDTLVIENIVSNQQHILDFAEDLHMIDWHPIEQVAIIYTASHQAWLLHDDYESIELIAEGVFYNFYWPSSTWSPSGNFAWIYFENGNLYLFEKSSNELNLVNPSIVGIVAFFPPMLRDGNWFQWQNKTLSEHLIISVNSVLFKYNPSSDILVKISDDANSFIISATSDYLVSTCSLNNRDELISFCIVDLIEPNITNIPPHLQNEKNILSQLIKWHPQKNWLILGEQDDTSLYLLRVASVEGDTQRVIETECTFYSESCVGWMPVIID